MELSEFTIVGIIVLAASLIGVGYILAYDGAPIVENGIQVGEKYISSEFKAGVYISALLSALLIVTGVLLSWTKESENKESRKFHSKLCHQCGYNFQNDQEFCPYCGSKRD